jgi:predicted Rossmann-fold nucleotide-binding protein
VPAYGDRLLELIRNGDAYVIMPGGSGTLAELFLTWEMEKNTSISERPIVLYGARWKRIIGFLSGELPEELSFSAYLHLLHFAETPDEAVAVIREELARRKETGKETEKREIDI